MPARRPWGRTSLVRRPRRVQLPQPAPHAPSDGTDSRLRTGKKRFESSTGCHALSGGTRRGPPKAAEAVRLRHSAPCVGDRHATGSRPCTGCGRCPGLAALVDADAALSCGSRRGFPKPAAPGSNPGEGTAGTAPRGAPRLITSWPSADGVVRSPPPQPRRASDAGSSHKAGPEGATPSCATDTPSSPPGGDEVPTSPLRRVRFPGSVPRSGGGTGRRARLRTVWAESPWEFDSPSEHSTQMWRNLGSRARLRAVWSKGREGSNPSICTTRQRSPTGRRRRS